MGLTLNVEEADALMRGRPGELLQLLHEVTGDATVTMDAQFLPWCIMLAARRNNLPTTIDCFDDPDKTCLDAIQTRYWQVKTPKRLHDFYPGGMWGDDGLLGWGEFLETLLAEDESSFKATLASLNRSTSTFDSVGQDLKRLIGKWIKAQPKQSWKDKRHSIRGGRVLCYHGCPFEGCRYNGDFIDHYSDLTLWITNRRSGEEVRIEATLWHWIARHHFFGGKQSRRRTDPAALLRVMYIW